MVDTKKYSIGLTVLGVVPFILGAVFLQMHIPYYAYVKMLFLQYGLLIFSFVMGSYWGIALSDSSRLSSVVAFISNGLLLLVWLGGYLLPYAAALGSLGLLFWFVLPCDYYFYHHGKISKSYFRCRFGISIVVGLCLNLVAWSL